MVGDCVFGCQPSLYIQWKSSITGYWYTYVHWCVCGFDARTKNLRVSKWYLDSIIVCIGLLSTLPDIYWLLFTYLGQVESGFQTVFISICRGSHSAMSTDAPSVHRRFSDFEGFDKGHPIYIYVYVCIYIYYGSLWHIPTFWAHSQGLLSFVRCFNGVLLQHVRPRGRQPRIASARSSSSAGAAYAMGQSWRNSWNFLGELWLIIVDRWLTTWWSWWFIPLSN